MASDVVPAGTTVVEAGCRRRGSVKRPERAHARTARSSPDQDGAGQPVVVRRHSSMTRRHTRIPVPGACGGVHMIAHSTHPSRCGATTPRRHSQTTTLRRTGTDPSSPWRTAPVSVPRIRSMSSKTARRCVRIVSRARGRSPVQDRLEDLDVLVGERRRGVRLLEAEPAGPVEVALGRRPRSTRPARGRSAAAGRGGTPRRARRTPPGRCRAPAAGRGWRAARPTTSGSSSAGRSSSAASSTASRRNCASATRSGSTRETNEPDLREHLNQALLGQQDQALPHRCPADPQRCGQLVLRQRRARRQLQRQHLAAQRLVHDAAVGALVSTRVAMSSSLVTPLKY